MANTVNDVMNVIASPDYGIKSIAGTAHETLAILQGTHNSQNNIHTIVNDVKNLLQKIVDTSSEKKSVEVSNNNVSSKINQRHIRDILDETKGIRKAIISLEKAIAKQSGTNVGVAKLSDKASQKVAKAMIKNIEKQNKGGGLSSLVDAFKKLKDISLLDIILGNKKLNKISKIFKDAKEKLEIKEKDLNNIIKLVNNAPQMIEALRKVSWKINRIIKNETIKKLSDILVGKNSLLSISQLLQKNEKVFDKAYESTKYIKNLISCLNKAMMKFVILSILSKLAPKSTKSIETMIEKIASIANILTKNKKDINNGAKVAKDITILVGNLLISSILLTAALIPATIGMLGSLALLGMVSIITKVGETLSTNKKKMNKAVDAALIITAFTGLMTITSLLLVSIAKNSLDAIKSATIMMGVALISSLTIVAISKKSKEIKKGFKSMLIIGASLLLFGIALKQITDATKGVSWKQVGIIGTLVAGLSTIIAVLGIPPISGFILMGAVAVGVMGATLFTFAKALKLISDLGTVPSKQTHQILNTIKEVGIFFKDNALNSEAIKNAKQYKKILKPFGNTIKHIAKIKELGDIPIKLVHQTLNAMHVISSYYIENPIEKKVIEQARKYKRMLKPFGTTLSYLTKLKEFGILPIQLVHQTLNAMGTIANYYINNPIEKETIKQAKKYKKMMKPFGNMLNYFTQLKNLGGIPMKFVYQTLSLMSTIVNYYINNPIKKETIKQAKKYQKLLKPFGKTIGYLSKLKEIGIIPAKLVLQTLNTMSTIANYYIENPIKKKAIKQARRYKRLLKPFGATLEYLSKLKELGSIPTKLVLQTLDTMSTISNFYRDQKFSTSDYEKAIIASSMFSIISSHFSKSVESLKSLNGLRNVPVDAINSITIAALDISKFYGNIVISDDIENKSILTELIVDNFINMAMNIQDKFANVKAIDYNSIVIATYAFNRIINYYRLTKFLVSDKKILLMSNAINSFVENTNFVKNNISEFTKDIYTNVNSAVKTLKSIIKYYTKTSFTVSNKKILRMNVAINSFVENTNFVKNNISKFTKDMYISVNSAVKALKSIIKYYTKTKFSVKNDAILLMSNAVNSFVENANFVKNNISEFTKNDYNNVKLVVKSMKQIFKLLKSRTLNDKKTQENITVLKDIAFAMSSVSNINPLNISSIGDALSNTLNEVNSVDISQVKAVTNMFNAFNGINKSKNIINKFTESVKEFTSTCNNLIDAMSNNTDAINNIDTSNIGGSFTSEIRENNIIEKVPSNNNNQLNGIRITNVDEIARTIAEKINGALSVDVPDAQVQLLINGTGGNEWTITRY